MRASWAFLAILSAGVLALAACSKQVDTNAVAPGTTGSGTSDAGGRSSTAQAGAGLNGGLGGNTAMGASPAASGAVPDGSSNTSPGSAVGTRP